MSIVGKPNKKKKTINDNQNLYGLPKINKLAGYIFFPILSPDIHINYNLYSVITCTGTLGRKLPIKKTQKEPTNY